MQILEFFLEEQSMAEILNVILPKVLPEGWSINHNVFLRTFSGKSELQKAVREKIKVYVAIGRPVGVVILHETLFGKNVYTNAHASYA